MGLMICQTAGRIRVAQAAAVAFSPRANAALARIQALSVRASERDKVAAVSLRELSHQRGVAGCREEVASRHLEDCRQCDGVDANFIAASRCDTVCPLNRLEQLDWRLQCD